MPDALLTIIVPTYNRASNLKVLLAALRAETASDSSVCVLVSDNGSTDDTPAVIEKVREAWPRLLVQRHERNLGADENFCSCVERVSTRYFWIIGDDDLPKLGLIVQLLALLRQSNPALVYMQSEWLDSIEHAGQGEPLGLLQAQLLDAPAFVSRVHVWMTFISGIVINREQLATVLKNHTVRRFTATHLVQLGWILPLLQLDARFLFISNRCVLATRANSGGYGLLSVFGINFARVVREAFGANSSLTRALINRNVREYLPGLVWASRSSEGTRFKNESPWGGMRKELGRLLLFWVLLLPIGKLPKLLAAPIYQCWRVVNRLSKELRKFAAHPQSPALAASSGEATNKP